MSRHATQQWRERRPASRLLFPWIGALLAALLGCSTQPPLTPPTLTPPTIDTWDRYHARLQGLQHWQLNGKLGVRIAEEGAESPPRGGSAYLHWQQHPDDYAIRLSGPLGQGTTWIKGSPAGVYLEQAGQAPLRADTPEALVSQTLGWDLPISDLFYWVRGIPAPRAPVAGLEKNDSGSLSQLEQSGWQLAFSRYNAVGPWQLPGKIVAVRGGLRLTLIIKDWAIEERHP